jgi:hypothetical protein
MDTELTMARARLAARRMYSASRSAFMVSRTQSPTINVLPTRMGEKISNSLTRAENASAKERAATASGRPTVPSASEPAAAIRRR